MRFCDWVGLRYPALRATDAFRASLPCEQAALPKEAAKPAPPAETVKTKAAENFQSVGLLFFRHIRFIASRVSR
jgi:hypothetical protein